MINGEYKIDISAFDGKDESEHKFLKIKVNHKISIELITKSEELEIKPGASISLKGEIIIDGTG